MGNMLIELSKKDDLCINEDINISVSSELKDKIKYKFIEGYDGIWNPIQDFSYKNRCAWTPKKVGRYMIMVQGKLNGSNKPYDYTERINVEVKDRVKLINDVIFEKNKLYIGDKLEIKVESNEEKLLYRFWIRGDLGWEPLRDYSTDNSYTFVANEVGIKEILVECKKITSENKVDDFTMLRIEVRDITEIEITDFTVEALRMVVNEELLFSVKANYDDKRPLLYKFLKIAKDGKVTCVQDFSSKKTVAFKEEVPGEYKLLCLVRDMLSNKEYDDRAMLIYKIKPYDKVKIKQFTSDITSPQPTDVKINLSSEVDGGREILYRYIIEGPIAEDSGYIRSDKYLWTPEEEGDYIVTLKAKDISYKGDYEDIRKFTYRIDEKGDRPVRIIDLKSNCGKYVLINRPVNIKCKATGGSKILYEFRVFKDGKLVDQIEYGKNNWVDFIPEECGEYEIEARIKDLYSMKEFDSSLSTFVNVKDYIPAEINYVLSSSKETYLINEPIDIEVIMENTNDSLVKFVTAINGFEVEDTGYGESKKLRLKPKCPGKYTVSIFAKNKKSHEEYDSKEVYSVYVHEVINVNSTKVSIIQDEIKVAKEVTFEVESKGGKDVCYEFYMMNKGNWVLVQQYSKKSYYTFIPFKKGKYKILVLSKSYHRKVKYEDYDMVEFNVEE